MKDIIEAVFAENEWGFQWKESYYVLSIIGDNAKYDCFLEIHENTNIFAFLTICNVNAPKEKYIELAELFTRVNQRLYIGGFELDFNDGEIRFKTSLFYDSDVSLSKSVIETYIYVGISILDASLPTILEVCFGTLSPKKGFNKIASELDTKN